MWLALWPHVFARTPLFLSTVDIGYFYGYVAASWPDGIVFRIPLTDDALRTYDIFIPWARIEAVREHWPGVERDLFEKAYAKENH